MTKPSAIPALDCVDAPARRRSRCGAGDRVRCHPACATAKLQTISPVEVQGLFNPVAERRAIPCGKRNFGSL